MKPLTLHPGKNSEREKLKVAINKKRLVRFNKFCETGWRWVLYLCAHLGGLFCLYDKPWVWNTAHCWHGYPYHPIDLKIWWYYMLELSLYWCLFFTQFSDLKRKDFWQMLAHHVATLFLLMFSWTNHMHRMGSFVLFIHDFSDHWLELAKLAIYAKYETACNVVFLVFTITWLYTRLSILPTVIIYSTVFEAAQGPAH
ncbi:ceramide synthase 6 isoform X2 [Eurytemora carolleeae]|nr:ceramide synthase 6 isoform X2 [Eurytemora carolleeae]|eukprot:XP_023341568.1 ceramide synthase 6-like isoform X2 [Eurytemora affinis]